MRTDINRAETDTSTTELYLAPAAMVTSKEELVTSSTGADMSTEKLVMSLAGVVKTKAALVISSAGVDASKTEVVMSSAGVVTSEAALVMSSTGEDMSKTEVVTSSAGTGSSFRYRIYHAVSLIIVTEETCHEACTPGVFKGAIGHDPDT